MQPVIDKLRENDYIIFYIETNTRLQEQFKLRISPTTIVMAGGKLKMRFDGVTTTKKIAKHLKTRKQQGLKTAKDKK